MANVARARSGAPGSRKTEAPAKGAAKPDVQWRVIGGLVGLVVGFASRKVLAFAWERVTGKKPPASADSPEIGLGEAIAYAVVMGLGMEVARIIATRAAAKKWQSWREAAASKSSS